MAFLIMIRIAKNISEASEVLIMNHYRKLYRSPGASQITYNYYRKITKYRQEERRQYKPEIISTLRPYYS